MRRIRKTITAVALTLAIVALPAPAHASTEGVAEQVCEDVNAALSKWGWQVPC